MLPVLLCVPVALDVVLAPRILAHSAAVVFPGQALVAGLVRMACPHVAVEILGLGAARLAKLALSRLGVIVDVFAMRLGDVSLVWAWEGARRDVMAYSRSHWRGNPLEQ